MRAPHEPNGDGLPPLHLLRSALMAASVCDARGVEATTIHRSYVRLPTDGLYHADDLERGELLLLQCGLLISKHRVLYPTDRLRALVNLPKDEAAQMLLAVVVEIAPPIWIHTAVRGDVVWPEFISEDDERILAQVIPDLDRREAFLLALGNRFPRSLLQCEGELGECMVVQQSRRDLEDVGQYDLAAGVTRVSLISDQLGYDVVAPTIGGKPRRMEVKTTTCAAHSLIEIHLTRNEAVVGLRDPSWALVICRVYDGRAEEIVGWCRAEALALFFPKDIHARGTWETVKLLLEREMLISGLPPCA